MPPATNSLFRFVLLSSALLCSSPLWATAEGDAQGGDKDDNAPDIVVVGHPPVDFGLLADATTIQGDALTSQVRGQIGESLAKLPGVSATGFAPGASRPVLRGFDGDRIRVLTDGIGSIDASSVSADHAVVFDALTVDRVDVVHGPAVLLYGGQAIGGAVNARDKRIPRSVPSSINVTATGSYASAANERAIGAALTAPITPQLAIQLDANWRKSDDLRVSGFVNSPSLRDALLDDAAQDRAMGNMMAAADAESLASQRDRIANSNARSYTLGAGLAYIGSGGSLGVSAQHYDTRYGVPLRPAAGTGAADPVSIDLHQTRIDLRGEVKLDGAFESLQLRGAYGNYAHVELEGDAAGTRFAGDGIEARIDLVQAKRSGWRGRSGLQIFSRKLNIAGAEAVVPNNNITRLGVFTLQSLQSGAFEVEVAGRYEHVRVTSQPAGFARSFGLLSGAAGLSVDAADKLKLGINFVHGARAPAPEELLSDGLHVATQAYEQGDRRFSSESSNGLEAYVRYQGDRASLSLTGYLTHFGNFIAALPTGAEVDGFPVFRYSQVPARFHGFEASASIEPWRWTDGSLSLDAAADYTHAQIVGIGPAPRIPPLRLRAGANLHLGDLRLRAEVERNTAQNRVASFENPVSGFTLMNLSADWHPLGEDGPLTVLLSADNLLNAAGRRAASFTRDFVPIAGRDVRISVRLTY